MSDFPAKCTMSISHYRISFLRREDCPLRVDPAEALQIVASWRNGNSTSRFCHCRKVLAFGDRNFALCCGKFFYKPGGNDIIQSLCIESPNVHFLPSYMKTQTSRISLQLDQSFLILPDPLYWQIKSSLLYERVIQFLLGQWKKPVTNPKKRFKRSNGSYHASTPALDYQLRQFYEQIMNTPLNHCSLAYRSQGKNTFFRKIAIAKRAEYTARGMIVPAPLCKPNEIILPEKMARALNVFNKWVIVNRMPSLLPENFIALRVTETWPHDCIGIPCEVLASLGADFDGDEVNIWPVYSWESQAECEFLLNARRNMKSFTSGIKLFPSQDMLVAFYLLFQRDAEFRENYGNVQHLPALLRSAYEMYGSEYCFDEIDKLRKRYLDFLENTYFYGITFGELVHLQALAKDKSFEEFSASLDDDPVDGCLRIQIESKSKGTRFHLYQLVGHVGYQYFHYSDREPFYIQSSFLEGLTPKEYLRHAQSGHEALIDSMLGVWKPGYNYFKLSHSLQDVLMNYEGHIEDNSRVVFENALEHMYYEDSVSNLTFNALVQKHFKYPAA